LKLLKNQGLIYQAFFEKTRPFLNGLLTGWTNGTILG